VVDDADTTSIPTCGILLETSMLVRYELLCALAPWIGNLAINHVAPFACFNSLPAPPWGTDSEDSSSLAGGLSSAEEKRMLVHSAPSCPSLLDLERSDRSDGISESLFSAKSIMYGWTISCLQQPNGIGHAIEHDLAMSDAFQRRVTPEQSGIPDL